MSSSSSRLARSPSLFISGPLFVVVVVVVLVVVDDVSDGVAVAVAVVDVVAATVVDSTVVVSSGSGDLDSAIFAVAVVD